MPIAKTKKNKGIIFILSAPSGCGKTTLCKRLLKSNPRLSRSVSFTTRPPRREERNSIDYHFVSAKKFNALVKKGRFTEYARVFGNLYGTPAAPLKQALKKNKDTLLSVDVKGAMRIKKLFGSRSVSIFISPPSLDALKKRLMKRHADSKKEINKRLKIVKKELSYLDKYDYVIVNRRLKNALSQLEAIIKAERNR